MEQLSALDSAFVYLESSRTPMHIGGVYLIDRAATPPGFGFDTLTRHVAARLPAARTFRQRLVEVPLSLGHPFWVEDPDFELERHLSHHRLPAPGGKRELMELAARLFAQPLDRRRPLWEMAFVSGLEAYPGLGADSMAVIGRVHHAAVDGVSGAEIMGALLDPVPEPRPPRPDSWRPERVPGGFELAARSYARVGGKTFGVARALGRTAVGLRGALAASETLLPEIPTLPLRAPHTPLNVPVGGRRACGGIDFALERLEPIRATVPGATINDVVLALCGGALRRWLDASGALPADPLVAMAPVSVRRDEERQALGNRVSAMLVELATEIEDPHLRLATIRRGTLGAKAYGRALPAHQLMELVPSETAALATRLYTRFKLSTHHRPLFNVVVTNVPGPPVPLYLAGARVHGHLGMAPVFDGVGLVLVVFSLAGRMSIGINACADALGDVQAFEAALEGALSELEAPPRVGPEVLASVAAPARRSGVEDLRAASDRLAAAIARLDLSLEEDS